MFEDLFEYQKSDVELYKIEQSLKNSEEYKKYALNYKAFDEAKKQLEKLEADAQVIIANQKKLEEMNASVEKIVMNLADIKNAIESEDEIEDVTEIEYYKDSLDKVVAVIESYEKEIKATTQKINEIKKKYNDAGTLYKKAKLGGQEAQEKYKKLQETVAGDVKRLKAVLAEGKPTLVGKYPEIMTIYERCKAEKKIPAVVEKNGDYCGACGVEIDAGLRGKLKNSGDFVECQNCHKIIIVK